MKKMKEEWKEKVKNLEDRMEMKNFIEEVREERRRRRRKEVSMEG